MKKIGLELSGIILTYILNSFLIILFIYIYDDTYDVGYLIIALINGIAIIPVALYQIGIIKNHYIAGIAALITNVLGGLFILTYEYNLVSRNELELKIKKIEALYKNGIISDEEYKLSRNKLIDKFF